MNIGDKAPEVLGINEKGEEILLSNYQGQEAGTLLLPEGQHLGMYCRSMLLA